MRNLSLICLFLVVSTCAVYLQVGDHQFLSFDDDVYVTNNPHVVDGLTGDNVVWAFSSVEAANWHPVTWLSHMADAQVFGMNPRGHHLTNVVIHALSALLLLLFLFQVTGSLWKSSFVAFMFALHPLHVESVAWVAERKDVLSAFFWLSTLLFYSKYASKKSVAMYLLSLLFFVMGLMSKPMTVTLPVVMLLLDYWPLHRYDIPGPDRGLAKAVALVKEKIPFFIGSIVSAFLTLYAQHEGGAIRDLDFVSPAMRIENAVVSYVNYLGKTVWPHDLAVFYPLPSFIPLWQAIGSLVVLLLVTAAAIGARRRYPYLMVGWFWYLITLLPVIGLVQVGGQSMADRYSYLPLIGIFIMVAWWVPDLAAGMKYRANIIVVLACAAILMSAELTWIQLAYWQDSISLFRHTIQVTSGNSKINYNLGVVYDQKGRTAEAMQCYNESLRINPDDYKSINNIGNHYCPVNFGCTAVTV